jgi:DNA-directed RNA polymerase subunit E'/Rpb7
MIMDSFDFSKHKLIVKKNKNLELYELLIPNEDDDGNFLQYSSVSFSYVFTTKRTSLSCFGDYGYVVKIHEIEIISDGLIIPEDPMCCSTYKVRFLCTMCRPLQNTTVIAKIVGMSEQLLFLSYGPLDIIVKTINGINKNLFTFNSNLSRWTYKKSDDKNTQKFIVLKNDSYLKVKIMSKKIVDKTKEIICIGVVENMATDKEIEKSIKDMYEPIKYDNIEEYIDLEKKIQQAIESNIDTGDVDTDIMSDNDI